jgi:hypothetical protein
MDWRLPGRGSLLALGGHLFHGFLLHGIWNFFGVLVGIAPVLEGQAVPENLAFLSRLNANRHLRLDATQSAIEPINASF